MGDSTVLITGATDGIGEETAVEMAKNSYNLILHGRDENKAKETINRIKHQTSNQNISYIIADYELFSDIEKMIKKLKINYNKIDILINNAGVYENSRVITRNGFEKTFQVNYLSHFYLTNMLMDLLMISDKPKIINVASMAHNRTIDFDNLQGEKSFNGNDAYGRSKLCNILFTFKLDREYKDSKLITNCLHPGVINTKLLQKGWGSGGSDITKGAENVLTVVNIDNESGNYYMHGKKTEPASITRDENIQDKLWEISTQMIENLNIEFNLQS